jgi:plasmid replication initiation protein
LARAVPSDLEKIARNSIHALFGFFDDDAEPRDELRARTSVANGPIVQQAAF